MQGETTEAGRPAERPSWRETVQDPAVASILVYTVIAIGAAIAAYLAIFTSFAPYDDEGTLLVSLQGFMDGHTLYTDVYSPYGPFYYEFFGGIFSLFGASVSNDLSRSVVIVVWVATSLVFGVSVQKLSGRLALGAAAMIVTFGSLGVLINEPMHPHGLAVLLLGAFFLLAVMGPPRGRLWSGALAGFLVAALLLTKVNLGAFALAGVVLAAVLVVEPFSRIRWLRWFAAVVYLAMPLVVMERDLGTAQVRELVMIVVLGGAALLVAGWKLRGDGGEADRPTLRWLLAGAAGFVVGCVAIMGVILATGSSLSGVYDGVVTEAMRVRDVSPQFLAFPAAAVDWALFALAAALIAVRFGRRPGPPSLWPGLLRALAGLTVWYALAHVVVVGLNPSAQNALIWPALLAWIAALPPAGATEGTPKRFLRIMLPALAIAEVLSVYPVAGSQVGIAAVAFVPVGGLLLADALTDLRAWAADRDGVTIARVGLVTTVLGVALVLQLGLDSIVRPAATNLSIYRNQEALNLPGGEQLHPPGAQKEIYEGLAGLIDQYDCSTFVGYPNVNSLYLWTGIDPPPPAAPGAWPRAMDSDDQQRVVDEMKASPRPCVFRAEGLAGGWLGGKPAPDRPLINYVHDDFRTVATIGEYEFAVPK